MKWEEVVLFVKMLGGGISVMLAAMALWTALGLPWVATTTYVDGKFQLAQSEGVQTRSLIIDLQKQQNKIAISNLRLEKYKLEQLKKTTAIDETTERKLQEITDELADALRERDRLFSLQRQ